MAEFKEHFIFKGGTSLSKVYNVIKRFSEDIDVAIDKSYLGFGDEEDLRNLSVKERDKIVRELDEVCKEIVQNRIFKSLTEAFSEIIGELSDNQWELKIDETDTFGQTLLFAFPKEESTVSGLEYIKPIVRIELGARPENQPTEKHFVQPYTAEEFPEIFENPKSEIKVLSVERTFWEKATILHDQFHRADDYKTTDRISRHYYDFFLLAKAGIAEKALDNLDLLKSVVINKKSFFYRAGAKYEEALIGQLHLVPSPARIDALKKDYEKMDAMFFETPPKFDEIINSLADMEKKINSKVS